MLGGDEPATAAAPGPPPAEPTHAERARTLAAGASRGSLSTVAVDPAGYPFGSVATYALDDRGNPLFFVSRMAEHTQNAGHDPRASLLVAEPVPDGTDPLAAGRVTLIGDMAEVAGDDRPAVRDRYLAANPASAYYIDFGDFVFFRLSVAAVRYVGGYGRMSWVDAADYAAAEADPLAGAPAAAIVEHMDADHAEALVLMCRHLVGLPETTARPWGASTATASTWWRPPRPDARRSGSGSRPLCRPARRSVPRWSRWCARLGPDRHRVP